MRNGKATSLAMGRGAKTVSGASVLLLAAILSACAVGPDYREPKVATPDQFLAAEGAHVSSADFERDFWKSFNDETLDGLVEQALTANHDVRIASSRLREARAVHGEATLDF